MNTGRELLMISTLLSLAAERTAGPLRFLLGSLAVLAWFQAVAVYKLVGIRLTHMTMMGMF